MRMQSAGIIVFMIFLVALVQNMVHGQAFPNVPTWSLQHGGRAVSIDFSQDGKILASSGEDNTIRLWDVRTQEQIGVLQGHTDEVWSVVFSPKGEMLASASLDKTVRLWNIETQEQIGLLQEHTDKALCVDFSPDGRTLASAGMDNTIRLWDIHEQKQIGALKGHTESVICVAFSPDGRTLASTSSDSDEILWDVQEQKQKLLISGRMDDQVVAFSPNGKLIAIGGGWMHDHIRLWDVDQQKEIGIFGERVPLGHTNSKFSMAFSPDGQLLASGGWKDKAIHFWNVESQEQVALLKGHEVDTWSIAFSPGGKWFASADGNGVILFWHLNISGSTVESRARQLTTWGETKMSSPARGRTNGEG
jgi:WD40 repeat protein